MKLTGEFEMRDIRGKRIFGYEAACDLNIEGSDIPPFRILMTALWN